MKDVVELASSLSEAEAIALKCREYALKKTALPREVVRARLQEQSQ
jgi:hypothetical protein